MGGRGSAGQHDAEEQPRRRLGHERRCEIVAGGDRRNRRPGRGRAVQEPRQSSADVADVRGPGREQLVVECGQDLGRSLGRGQDRRCGVESTARQPDSFLDERRIDGHESLRLEDFRLAGAVQLAQPRGQRFQLRGGGGRRRPDAGFGPDVGAGFLGGLDARVAAGRTGTPDPIAGSPGRTHGNARRRGQAEHGPPHAGFSTLLRGAARGTAVRSARSASTASTSSWPSAERRTRWPRSTPAASTPIRLLASTGGLPSVTFSRRIAERKPDAALTSAAAGRACRPASLWISTSMAFNRRLLAAWTRPQAPYRALRYRNRRALRVGLTWHDGTQWGLMRENSALSMDRSPTSADAPTFPSIVGLAALQDLDMLLEGIADPNVQRQICRQVMEARRKLLGTEHPATLEAEARLASISLGVDDYSTARDQYAILLERCERVFGPRHLDTLSAAHGLAVALSYLDRPEEARPLYERVVAGRRNSLGPEDPATLSALHNLGLTQRTLADDLSARSTFESLLESQRQILGPDSIATIRTMANLGSVLIALEDFGRANEVLTERVERSREVLGPTHPDTLEAMLGLARALVGVGELRRRAGRSPNRRWPRRSRSMAPNSAATLAARGQHGRLLLRLGDAQRRRDRVRRPVPPPQAQGRAGRHDYAGRPGRPGRRARPVRRACPRQQAGRAAVGPAHGGSWAATTSPPSGLWETWPGTWRSSAT